MYHLGIDMGASSVKLAALDEDGRPALLARRVHAGAPGAVLRGLLDELDAALGLASCAGWRVCGTDAALVLAHAPGAEALGDIPALTGGAAVLVPAARTVVEIGAQGARYLTGLGGGGMPRFAVNEGCAAGTGSFFEDQMMRLGLPLESYSELAGRAASVPRLSGRCAVFAKTDIIHRQQEGVPVEDILQGLCHAMVRAYKATIVRSLPVERPVALAGGVLLNAGVVRAVREVFGLAEDELLVDPSHLHLAAAGAAREARLHGGSDAAALARLARGLGDGAHAPGDPAAEGLARLDPLPDTPLDSGSGFVLRPEPWPVDADGRTPCTLGVDVGSTSTNVVLCDLDGNLLDAQYLRTRGNPRAVVREGLASAGARLGGRVRVVAAATTGSGRKLIGEMIGADLVRDEITCQARGAVAADPLATTVMEIGGQDSKFVALSHGAVTDFQMNKVCAAGTGSFVEEQAARLDIPLPSYGALALSARRPVDLGERCTVFVETAIGAALADGATKAEVAAGLCQSVVRNYLHKVVGTKPVGDRIVLQGGVCYNPAVVAAFRQAFGDRVTVNPCFAVSGAWGAALLALDWWRAQGGDAPDPVVSSDAPDAQVMQAMQAVQVAGTTDPAAFSDTRPAPGRATAFRGFDLSGAQVARDHVDPAEVAANRAYFARTKAAYEAGYTGMVDPAKKTVGIPRALMMYKLFPMARAFFEALGYNVLITRDSDEETVRACQTAAQGETCFPFKLLHGHMAQLVEMGVDYVFMPRIHTVRHVKSTVRHNYACPYMQVGAELAALELGLAEKGIELISPQFEMDYGQNAIADSLLAVGERLGHGRAETARAMLAGGYAVMKFTKDLEDYGDELIRSLKPGERAIVLVTRNYNFEDPVLCSGVPEALIERGCKVLTVSHLHAHSLDVSMDYPGLYWPFSQHVVSGAKLVRRDPRLFAVYLTNHGCGPDTMVNHLFRREMGDKPYLQIEMDEHYSPVGIVTRVEAFLNAIAGYKAPEERLIPTSVEFVDTEHVAADPAVPLALPACGPYGRLAASWLRGRGFSDVRVLEPTAASLEAGRRETTSKECLTFANLLGLALTAARETGEPGGGAAGVPGSFALRNVPAEARLQLALPAGEGAEADGQYARVVRSILDEKGYRDVAVVAPALEKLPCAVDDVDGLFVRVLAGDVVWAAPPALRDEVARLFEDAGASLSLETVLAAARAVGAAGRPAGKRIALVGEWPLVAGNELAGSTWDDLEAAGHDVRRMPLAEYLWCLWRDGAREDEHERVTNDIVPILGETGLEVTPGMPDFTKRDFGLYSGGHCGRHGDPQVDTASGASLSRIIGPDGMPQSAREPERPRLLAYPRALSTDDWRELLERLAAAMRAVHEALGEASGYAEDLEELDRLATELLGQFRGANARYRHAKAVLESRRCDGVVAAASMYENVDIVLRLMEQSLDLEPPILHLSFDGVLDAGPAEKLRTYLYYL